MYKKASTLWSRLPSRQNQTERERAKYRKSRMPKKNSLSIQPACRFFYKQFFASNLISRFFVFAAIIIFLKCILVSFVGLFWFLPKFKMSLKKMPLKKMSRLDFLSREENWDYFVMAPSSLALSHASPPLPGCTLDLHLRLSRMSSQQYNNRKSCKTTDFYPFSHARDYVE